jgi:drug/metabolite transporter (DMT)-like permease
MWVNNVLPKLGETAMLMALPPVILLPVSYFVFKEKISWQAILGTILAIVGVAVLFLA